MSQHPDVIKLSTIFQELVHPIKPLPLLSDPRTFFNDTAYEDCLVQLSKFLSLVESSIAINVDVISNDSPVLVSYANSFNKSIKIVRHSLWFLQLVPTVDNEKKLTVFQNSIDIFDNAVCVIEEIINIFFSDEVISSLQKELRSNILCLYDQFLKVSPFLNIGRIGVNSDSVSTSVLITGNGSENELSSSEPSNVCTKLNLNVTKPATVLKNELSSSRENLDFNSDSKLIPISCHESIVFSDLAHKKRFDQICKRIKSDINYFAIIKSKQFKLKCLLCDLSMCASKVESHVIKYSHLCEKARAPCFNILSTLAVKNFSEKFVDAIEDAPEACELFPLKTDVKNTTFSDPSHKKRFDEICESIKDEIYHFEVVKFEKKLKLKCLLCDQKIPASAVESHVDKVRHLQEREKARVNAMPDTASSSDCGSSVSDSDCENTMSDSASSRDCEAKSDSASSTDCEGAMSNSASTDCELEENNLPECANDPNSDLSSQLSEHPEEIPVSESIGESSAVSQETVLNPLDCTSLSNINQSVLGDSSCCTLVSKPLEKDFIFSNRTHKKRFEEICKNIKDEVNHFKIVKSKKLEFVCLLCSRAISSSNIEHHVTEMGHLRRKSKTLGDSASSVNCTSVKADLVTLKSCTSGPESESLLNTAENIQLPENAVEVDKTVKNGAKSSVPSKSFSKIELNISNCTDVVNTDQLSDGKDTDNINCNSAQKNLVVRESPDNVPVNSPNSLQSDFSKSSYSNRIPSVSAPENTANSSSRHELKPISYENFTLSNHHKKQLDDLCGIIGSEINYFLVSRSKHLKLVCLLCNQTMKASCVVGHVNQQGHLLNAARKENGASLIPKCYSKKVAELSEDNKQYLIYIPSFHDFVCTLCNLALISVKDKWFEHFQSEYHNSRLQTTDTLHAENELTANFQHNPDHKLTNDNAVVLNSHNHTQADYDISTILKQENILALPQLKQSSHETEFLELKEKINDQMEYFSVHSLPDQRKLKMMCKLCNISLPAAFIETHIKEKEHSQHVFASQVKEEYKKYLEFCPSDHGYRCIVCKEALSNYFLKIWNSHFESEIHCQNEQKLKKYVPSFSNTQNNSCANSITKSEVSVKEEIANSKLERQNLSNGENYESHSNISLNCCSETQENGNNFIPKESATEEDKLINVINNQSPSANTSLLCCPEIQGNINNLGPEKISLQKDELMADTTIHCSSENVVLNNGLDCAKKSDIISGTSYKTIFIPNDQDDAKLSVSRNAFENVSSNSELSEISCNFVEDQKRDISETIKKEMIITDKNKPSQTTTLSSENTTSGFAQNYVNIFAKDKDSTYSKSSEIKLKRSSLEFKQDSHKKEYDILCSQIGGQTRHFLINIAPQKKLSLLCKICNQSMTAKKAVSHVTCTEHLANLLAPFMSEESKAFLGLSKTVYCTLCDVPLYKDQCLWFDHFQSEFHVLKLREQSDDFWSLKVDSCIKVTEECEKCDLDVDAVRSESITDLNSDFECTKIGNLAKNVEKENLSAIELCTKAGSSVKNDKKENLSCVENYVKGKNDGKENLSSDENRAEAKSSGKNDEQENFSGMEHHAKVKSLIKNDGKENLSGVQNHASILKAVSRNPCESIISKPEIFKVPKIVVGNTVKVKNRACEFMKQDEKITDQSKQRLSHFMKSTAIDSDLKPNYVNIFAKIKDSFSPEAFKLTLPEFKQSAHKQQYDALHDHIGDQIQYFTIKSAPKKKLRLTCTMCIRQMTVNKVTTHIISNEHLSNLLAPFMSKDNKVYLENHSKTIRCTLCDVLLYQNQCLWFEHFQSEFHVSKLGLKDEKCGSESHTLDNLETRNILPSENGLETSVANEELSEEDSAKYICDLSNLKFAQYLHSVQFMKLIQRLNDQVNHFSFESRLDTKNLRFICKLCDDSFVDIEEAAEHVKEPKHKMNLGLFGSETLSIPAIRECSWTFLKPCLMSKSFRCTWCNVKLSSKFDEWMEHFRSESHNLKLERLPTNNSSNSGANSKTKFENAEPVDYTLDLCIPPPISLEYALNSDYIRFDKKTVETVKTELDFQANFFLIFSPEFEPEKVKLLCKLCAKALPVTKAVSHVESKTHLQNIILPLMSKESKMYLDWCDVTRCHICTLCEVTLSRGMCLLEHFQSEAHLSKFRELNGRSVKNENRFLKKSQNFMLNEELITDCLPTPGRSSYSIATPDNHTDLSAEINALSRIKKTLKLYRNKHILNFLQLACKIEDHVNFYSFEAGLEDLNIICQLCNVCFTDVETAIDHVQEKKHVLNVEKNNSEVTIVPWIPSVCDGNWRFLWPFPDLRNYFCLVCNKVLPKHILSWVHHFRSKPHNQKLRGLHQDLLTVETCFLSNENKDKDWAFGTLAPENLFQESFNLEALQFSSVAHKIQFENLAKRINYQINCFLVNVKQKSKELALTCKICNKKVCVSEVEEHVSEQEHLLNLAMKIESKPEANVSEISEDDWQFLDFDTSSQEYMCTLCDVELTSSQESWAKHFQSEVHRSKAKEPLIGGTLPTKEDFASKSADSSDTCDRNTILFNSCNSKLCENFENSSNNNQANKVLVFGSSISNPADASENVGNNTNFEDNISYRDVINTACKLVYKFSSRSINDQFTLVDQKLFDICVNRLRSSDHVSFNSRKICKRNVKRLRQKKIIQACI